MVERQLPKLNVAGSIPVSRSNSRIATPLSALLNLHHKARDRFFPATSIGAGARRHMSQFSLLHFLAHAALDRVAMQLAGPHFPWACQGSARQQRRRTRKDKTGMRNPSCSSGSPSRLLNESMAAC